MSGMDGIGSGQRELKTPRGGKDSAARAGGKERHSVTEPSGGGVAWPMIAMDAWAQTMVDCAAGLETEYPGIRFEFTAIEEDSEIQSWAVTWGNGVHMAVAPQFMQGMISSPAAFAAGQARLQTVLKQLFTTVQNLTVNGQAPSGMGAVIKANGEASLWTVLSAPADDSFKKFWDQFHDDSRARSYQEKGGRNVKEIKTADGILKFVFTKRLNYSAGSDIARLAGLSRIGPVHSFIGGLQAYMNQVRSDRNLEQAEIKQVVAKLKGVILRASIKIKNLQEEEILEHIRRRSIEAKHVERAAKIAAELRRRRTARRSREYAKGPECFPLSDLFDRRNSAELNEHCADGFGNAPLSALPMMPNLTAAAAAPAAPAAAGVIVTTVDVLA